MKDNRNFYFGSIESIFYFRNVPINLQLCANNNKTTKVQQIYIKKTMNKYLLINKIINENKKHSKQKEQMECK